MDTDPAKPLPGRTLITGVAGVFFHQDVTADLLVGDPVVVEAYDTNPVDPHAVAVRTEDGKLIGHVPARGHLNSRLRATGGTRWEGRVQELYDPPQPERPRGVTISINLQSSLPPASPTLPLLNAAQAAAAAGRGERNTAWARSATRKGELLFVNDNGKPCYPAAQFHNGGLLPIISEIRAALAEQGITGAAAGAWLTTPCGALNGTTPAENLVTHPDKVLSAAGAPTTAAPDHDPSAATPTVLLYTPAGRLLGEGVIEGDTAITKDGGLRYPLAAVRVTPANNSATATTQASEPVREAASAADHAGSLAARTANHFAGSV